MGQKDIQKLLEINKIISQLKKIHGWNFSFKVDHGNYETALVFNHEIGNHRVPSSLDVIDNWKTIKYPEEVKCPDLLCLQLRAIIEYEENTGRRLPGARLAMKGHGFSGDIPNKRDTNRNQLYSKNFRLFQVWQDEGINREQLEQFLIKSVAL